MLVCISKKTVEIIDKLWVISNLDLDLISEAIRMSAKPRTRRFGFLWLRKETCAEADLADVVHYIVEHRRPYSVKLN